MKFKDLFKITTRKVDFILLTGALILLSSIWIDEYRIKLFFTGVWSIALAILLTLGIEKEEAENK
jgi:hypothetical protein